MKMKPLSVLWLLLLTGVSCSSISEIRDPFAADPEPAETETLGILPLRILALDVGQGDATLVTGPTGRRLLIDAGGPGAGFDRILPRLRAEGVDSLDWILATHYDADHIGGIPEILSGEDRITGTDDDVLPTRALLDRGDRTEKATPAFRDYLASAPPNRREAVPGTVLDLGDGAEAAVIVANGRYADGGAVHLNPDEENEASIGLLIRYKAFSYFTAGDLTGGGGPGGYETKDLESEAGRIVGDVDILHAGHHGSSSSTNAFFLDRTRPEAVILSVGRDNDYGHPSGDVLDRIEASGAEIYRTDIQSDIQVVTDGDDIDIGGLDLSL